MPDTIHVFHVHLARLDLTSPALTDTICEQLCSATSLCPDMHLLQHYTLHGWPPAKKLPHHQLQALWHFREELSIANSILLNSTRAIVPTSLRPSMLSKIHHFHGGAEHCLRFARDAIFWPNMHIASHALVWKASCHWAYTIPSCPYTTLAVHPARYTWVPTEAVPSHRRPLQWFLWIGPADKHSIHHHRRAHHSPLCRPRRPITLYDRQCPERQISLMTTNFIRKWANKVQPHKSTPYPQCLAYGAFFFLFMLLSFYFWTMIHINFFLDVTYIIFLYLYI